MGLKGLEVPELNEADMPSLDIWVIIGYLNI